MLYLVLAALVLMVSSPTWAADTLVHGHVLSDGAAPTVECGTGATVIGSDLAGSVTVGVGPLDGGLNETCTVVFNAAWPSAPHCVVGHDTANSGESISSSIDNIALRIDGRLYPGNVYSWVCIGDKPKR